MAKRKTAAAAGSGDRPFEEVVDELRAEVTELKNHVNVLITAIDDLRVEVEWATRNIIRPACAVSTPVPAAPKPTEPEPSERVEAASEDKQPPPDNAPSAPERAHQGGLFD
jgi:hypothetical protein